jgi:hypothetical protein
MLKHEFHMKERLVELIVSLLLNSIRKVKSFGATFCHPTFTAATGMRAIKDRQQTRKKVLK